MLARTVSISQARTKGEKVQPDMHDEVKEIWVCNPFDSDVEDLVDISNTAGLEEQLTEIRMDETPRLRIRKQSLTEFCIRVKKKSLFGTMGL